MFNYHLKLDARKMGTLVLHDAVVAALQRAILQCRNDGVGVDAGRDRRNGRAASMPGFPGDMPAMLLKVRRSSASLSALPALVTISAVTFAMVTGSVTSRRNRPTTVRLA